MRILEILERYRTDGHVAEVVEGPGGRPAVVIFQSCLQGRVRQPPLVPGTPLGRGEVQAGNQNDDSNNPQDNNNPQGG